MVTIKGGGTTYTIASGKQMPWSDVPQVFKDEMTAQAEQQPPQCAALRADTQQCIEDRGFWHEACCRLRDQYDLCVGNALRDTLKGTCPNPATVPAGGASSSPLVSRVSTNATATNTAATAATAAAGTTVADTVAKK